MPAAINSDSAPLVTIAIPTFNRLDYLKEAVASALAQTYGNIEVLISDDGSTRLTEEWCRELARRDARVSYRRNARNLGLAGNWNALADTARGEYLVIIGDDDRLLPEFVETLMAATATSAQVAFSNHYLIDGRGARLEAQSLECTRHYRREQLPAGAVANAAACVWQNSVPMSAALIRTSDVRRLRFKEDLNTPEIEFFARLAREDGRFTFVPAYLAEYRTHAQSATANGLRSEKLVQYLDAIQVSAEVEPHKRELMASLLVNAVGRCLQQNEPQLARQFLQHQYYPRPRLKRDTQRRNGNTRTSRADSETGGGERASFIKTVVTGYAQRLCASLPSAVGCSAYRFLQRVRHAR